MFSCTWLLKLHWRECKWSRTESKIENTTDHSFITHCSGRPEIKLGPLPRSPIHILIHKQHNESMQSVFLIMHIARGGCGASRISFHYRAAGGAHSGHWHRPRGDWPRRLSKIRYSSVCACTGTFMWSTASLILSAADKKAEACIAQCLIRSLSKAFTVSSRECWWACELYWINISSCCLRSAAKSAACVCSVILLSRANTTSSGLAYIRMLYTLPVWMRKKIIACCGFALGKSALEKTYYILRLKGDTGWVWRFSLLGGIFTGIHERLCFTF